MKKLCFYLTVLLLFGISTSNLKGQYSSPIGNDIGCRPCSQEILNLFNQLLHHSEIDPSTVMLTTCDEVGGSNAKVSNLGDSYLLSYKASETAKERILVLFAHELGHVFLKHEDPVCEPDRRCCNTKRLDRIKRGQEKDADYWAGWLLGKAGYSWQVIELGLSVLKPAFESPDYPPFRERYEAFLKGFKSSNRI
jgi:hypothetical protein